MKLCPDPSASSSTFPGFCVSIYDPYVACDSPDSCSPPAIANATLACDASGHFAIGQCFPGFADCDGIATNGCEADLHSTSSCGACATKCSAGQVCTASGCAASCPFPTTDCGGSCVDVSASAANCAGCGSACQPYGEGVGTGNFNYELMQCVAGACQITCPSGYDMIGRYPAVATYCTDPNWDPAVCGPTPVNCNTGALNSTRLCIQGACVTRCAPGWTDCGNGDCEYLPTSTTACGTCGHACGAGQACVQSTCTPVSALAIASSLKSPDDLVVDGSDVFFTTLGDNSVYRVSTTGGPLTTIATSQDEPSHVAVDASYVYWTSYLGGGVLRAPRTGLGTPQVLARPNKPWSIAVDDVNVYWVDGSGAIGYIAKTGVGMPSTLAGQVAVSGWGAPLGTNFTPDIVISNGTLYTWETLPTSAEHILATATLPAGPLVGVPGADATSLQRAVDYTAQGPALAVASGNIYFGTGFFSLANGEWSTWQGQSAQGVTSLVSGMAVDGCELLFVSGGLWALKIPFQSNVPAVPIVPGAHFQRVVISGGFVYWTDADGFIDKMPVPP
jgi:hypothetical protein